MVICFRLTSNFIFSSCTSSSSSSFSPLFFFPFLPSPRYQPQPITPTHPNTTRPQPHRVMAERALEALLRPALRKRKRRRPRWETFVASLARRIFGMDVVEVNETTEEVGSRPRMQMLAVVVVVVYLWCVCICGVCVCVCVSVSRSFSLALSGCLSLSLAVALSL